MPIGTQRPWPDGLPRRTACGGDKRPDEGGRLVVPISPGKRTDRNQKKGCVPLTARTRAGSLVRLFFLLALPPPPFDLRFGLAYTTHNVRCASIDRLFDRSTAAPCISTHLASIGAPRRWPTPTHPGPRRPVPSHLIHKSRGLHNSSAAPQRHPTKPTSHALHTSQSIALQTP